MQACDECEACMCFNIWLVQGCPCMAQQAAVPVTAAAPIEQIATTELTLTSAPMAEEALATEEASVTERGILICLIFC